MQDPVLLIAAAVLGAIAGSFLNALIFRYRTGRSVLRGRSACMHCGSALGARDLVPVFSYLFLRGRCRRCRSALSPQYPLVEAAGALIGALLYLAHPEPGLFAAGFFAWMTLLFIFVYDLRHQIIPWSASAALALFALLHALLQGSLPDALAGGFVLAAPLFLISLVSRGRAMGWGDGALELGLGFLLGLSAGFLGLLIAVWAGALVGIGLSLTSRGYTMKSEVPFAPFLIFGAACAYFSHADIFSFIAILPF